jgi:capsular exopolysaccharide synthesis family protein
MNPAVSQEMFAGGEDRAVPVDSQQAQTPPILLQYWQAVLRHRWVIIGIIAAALVAGLVITLLSPPLYTADAKVQVNREQKNITSVEGLDSREANRDNEFYATQYALLKAESLARRVSRKLNLTQSEEFFAAHGVEPAAAPSGASPAAQQIERERQVVALLLANIEVAPVRNSSLIDLLYTSRDPAVSARIANAWMQGFIDESRDRQFSSTADARTILEQRLSQLRERLEQSERAAVNYATNRDIVTLDSVRDAEGRTITGRTLAATDLEALNSALAVARADRIAAQARVGSGAAASGAEALNNQTIGELRKQRAQLAAEYAKLLVQFEPAYPALRAIKEQMDALDTSIAREAGRVGDSRRQAYNEALSRENQLQAQVNALKNQFDRQRQDSIQYTIYQREADTNRELYEALLQRYKEIGVAGTVGISNILVVDQADVPTAPSSPNMMLNLALALLLGLTLAGATTFALEQIDEGIRNPDDVRNYLHTPLLGNVPLEKGNLQEEIADPKSHLAEAYFSILSTLAFATNHGFPRSLLVSSSQPAEGKSVTAYSLAEIISRTGRKVLLVDGDMRKPSLHEEIGVDNRAGLSNLLAGATLDQIAIKRVGTNGLSVVTTGPMPPNPAELLSGDSFERIIEEFGRRFDVVIVDGPPVLGLSDSPLMGRTVEAVVFVVQAERTSRRVARSALQRLRSMGARVAGTIVTKVDFSNHSYGYGYGYGYGTNYGYGEKSGREAA